MKISGALIGIWATLSLMMLAGCDQTEPTPLAPEVSPLSRSEGQSPKKLGPEVCAFGQDFTLVSTNPYYPLVVGSFWELEGVDEGTPLRLRIDITSDTEIVGGVETRVLTETEWEFDEEDQEFEVVEISYNYFAEVADGPHAGTVCYLGEAVDIFEDGELVSHEGEWRADEPGSAPGIFMPANPRPGMRFQSENAPGVAEDEGRIVGIGPVTVPAGTFTETIRVREFNPLDEEKEYKVFARGVGTIIDGPLSLVAYLLGG